MIKQKDILKQDLIDLYFRIKLECLKKGLDEKTTEEIAFSVSDFEDKKLYLQYVSDYLSKMKHSEWLIGNLTNEIRWLIRKDNFRWNFKIFDSYGLKMKDIVLP